MTLSRSKPLQVAPELASRAHSEPLACVCTVSRRIHWRHLRCWINSNTRNMRRHMQEEGLVLQGLLPEATSCGNQSRCERSSGRSKKRN